MSMNTSRCRFQVFRWLPVEEYLDRSMLASTQLRKLLITTLVLQFLRLLRLAKLARLMRVQRFFRRWESWLSINYRFDRCTLGCTAKYIP